jgi:serine/threonine-protein kinase RsbW
MRILKFTIGSEFPACGDIREQILAEVARHGFDSESAYGIRLALEEALANAIKHGNRLDHQKKVHVEAKISKRKIEICVEDEGIGFDRTSVPDPTLAENLEKSHGRGILLIESYMDEVHWSRGGRRLKMIRKNASGTKQG